jgi:hypothetical protein
MAYALWAGIVHNVAAHEVAFELPKGKLPTSTTGDELARDEWA